MMIEKIALAMLLGLSASGCDHECACAAHGTWEGKTTIASTIHTNVTRVCSGTADVTNKRDRAIDCQEICAQRGDDQHFVTDVLAPDSPMSRCEKACESSAKVSMVCATGKRVGTF